MSAVAHWGYYPAAHDRLLSYIGITTHWAILQYVLGLPFMAFIALLLYLRSKDESWKTLARTLVKGFIIVFAVGAATGTASEFGLVLLWPNLTEAAGRYIYFPLYMEIFAFMMEVIFLYLLWYGWDRFRPAVLAMIALLGFLGAWYSAAMILSVNSYMVAPTGIEPAYIPNGTYLYPDGYPKIELYVPEQLVSLLDIAKLEAVGVSIRGATSDSVIVAMPSSIVQELAREAWEGTTLGGSILVKGGFVNTTTVSRLTPDDVKALASAMGVPIASLQGTTAQDMLLSIPVKSVVDYILINTIKHEGYMTVTFKSPVYLATLMHSLGAGLTVSGFTVLAAYSLRYLRMPADADPEYRRYVENALRFAAVFSAIAIAYQGFIAGHEMGKAVAYWNPEKFAATEGTSQHIASLSRLLHVDKLMPLIAYGSFHAALPDYDLIPANYCVCKLTGLPNIADCRPPIFIHYVYYTKILLGLLLGLYGLLVALLALSKYPPMSRILEVLRPKEDYPGWLLSLAVPAAGIAQIVSNMGWVVREVGRKPWTIYGIMTVDVAHTANPPSTWEVAAVAAFFLSMLALLLVAVYRILWVPGRPAVAGS